MTPAAIAVKSIFRLFMLSLLVHFEMNNGMPVPRGCVHCIQVEFGNDATLADPVHTDQHLSFVVGDKGWAVKRV
jgi:hypothetical protein